MRERSNEFSRENIVLWDARRTVRMRSRTIDLRPPDLVIGQSGEALRICRRPVKLAHRREYPTWRFLGAVQFGTDIAFLRLVASGQKTGVVMDISSSSIGWDTLVFDKHRNGSGRTTTLLHDERPAPNHEAATLISSFLRASFPPSLPEVDGLQFEALYLSCGGHIIGGDWYDALALPDGSVAVSLGDVTGHSLESAVLMGKLRYSMRVVTLRAHALETGSPASVLQSVEDGLRTEHPEASATAFLGIISSDRTHMHYASAGHPPPLLAKTSGETVWLESGETPLGWGSGLLRNDHFIDLTGAWGLFLYTDGVVEAGRNIVEGLERLQKAVENPAMRGVTDLLPQVVERSLAAPPHDDIAMLAVTFG
jgi:hypothetical protein